ncbi:ATP-binding protein [Microlunatus elymi]|uniref:ATP-binding protein n=2 Tax=Microlunatus elymi TaxID=2596828 RepID=A0A516PUP2_9ACTN|nr:ATP-binding protein [Microlunatus elymi]
MIGRPEDEARLQSALGRSPVVVLSGPRQVGKSTLARMVVDPPRANTFDLEDPRDLSRLGDPTLTLSGLEGTVVIDEAQHRGDLFPILRVLVDEDRRPGRFLVLGSASPDLIGLASESLAGRVTVLELPGLRLDDVGVSHLDQLWLRGGLPLSYLAASDQLSAQWRDDYVATFLERDLGNLGVRVPATTMRRFWTMIAHYHGQYWNASELARSLGVSRPTIDRYLDALTDALVVRQLQPWYANLAKRQVRAPKVYVRDPGLLHRLLQITDREDLLGHPKAGASWEGFIIEQFLAAAGVADPHFWATHSGAEIDLVFSRKHQRIGLEVKLSDHPRMTPSIRNAIADLELDLVLVVHAGADTYPLADRVTAVAAADLLSGSMADF